MKKLINTNSRKNIAGIAAITLFSGAIMFSATGIYRITYSSESGEKLRNVTVRNTESADNERLNINEHSQENREDNSEKLTNNSATTQN